MPLTFGLFLFKLTGGGRQQSRESCPLNITEHAGSCWVLHPGRGCPVWMGNPWVVTVVTVYDIGTDPWCIFLWKEVGRGERWCDSTIWLKQKTLSQNEPIIPLRNTRMFHIKSQKAHFWGWQTCGLTRQQIMFDKCQNFVTHQAVLLPGRVDPPWWGSAGAGEQQGEACVVLCWCGCIVWSHLKEPVDDVGRKADDGSSHPGPGNCAVQVCLASPTGVSLVGCSSYRKSIDTDTDNWIHYVH